jgi:hypothetical protein
MPEGDTVTPVVARMPHDHHCMQRWASRLPRNSVEVSETVPATIV